MAVTSRRRPRHKVPVPVFAAAGADAWGAVQELRGHSAVRLVPTPRHAAVLLVAGSVDERHLPALQRVHDQMPHPRTAVAWRAGAAAAAVPVATRVAGDARAVVPALRQAFAVLLDEPSTTTADLLPDVDPNPWRGVGPFGQGGEGMMGGTPYGRPMAMTSDDRDGLALDQLQLRLGPFLDPFPAGLVLDVVLQGEVLQSVEVVAEQPVGPDTAAADGTPADVRSPPARRGLQWLSHALHVHGLDALSARAARLAADVGAGTDRAELVRGVRILRRRIHRSGLLAGLRGVGRVDGEMPAGAEHLLGDARDRWLRRMDAIGNALRGESPQPALTGVALPSDGTLLPAVLCGATWTAAISTIVSLHLDVVPRQSAVQR